MVAHQYRHPKADEVIKHKARQFDVAFEDYIAGMGREAEAWYRVLDAWTELRRALGTFNGLETSGPRAA